MGLGLSPFVRLRLGKWRSLDRDRSRIHCRDNIWSI